MHLKRFAFVVLLLPLLAACAGGGVRSAAVPASDDEQLSQRPIERWNHLIAKQPDLAWEYLSPGYRSTRNRDEYVATMGNRPVRWMSVDYHSRNCSEEGRFCEVNLKVHFSVMSRQLGVGEIQSFNFVTERWIKSGGVWYHVPEDVSG